MEYDPIEITRLFVFGTAAPSEEDYNNHIRSSSAPAPQITYSMAAYMTTGAGRYAYPALFGAVKLFFSDNTVLENRTYTWAELRTALGIATDDDSGLKLNISNYATDTESADYALRSYIFGNATFRINPDKIRFTVNNGEKSIENLEVFAETDNFDFDSKKGSISQYINDFVLNPTLNMFNLGKKPVTINYDGAGKLYQSFSFSNFIDSVNLSDSVRTYTDVVDTLPGFIGDARSFQSIFRSLIRDKFLGYKKDGAAVIYGTADRDIINHDSIQNISFPPSPRAPLYIAAGDGNDDVTGSKWNDVILGGRGNDFLDGGDEGADTLVGGMENDVYIFKGDFGHDVIYDIDGNGDLQIDGFETGMPEGKKTDIDIYASEDGDVIYQLVKSKEGGKDLNIIFTENDNRILIKNWAEGSFGITLKEEPKKPKKPSDPLKQVIDPIGTWLNQQFLNALLPPRRDPLAIDLDGDGIETVAINTNSPILFDHNADGIKTATGWLSPDDAWLVMDRPVNGAYNGTIDSGRELFGADTPLPPPGSANPATRGGFDPVFTQIAIPAPTGFEALSQLDTGNGQAGSDGYRDQVFDSRDVAFSQVRLWQDLNQDGISQSNELSTLAEKGVKSISLVPSGNLVFLGDGANAIDGKATVTLESGAHTNVGNVSVTGVDAGNIVLQSNGFYREFSDKIPYSAAALRLPEVKGRGWVRDLREAMSIDSDLGRALTTAVQNYASATTRDEQLALLDSVINAWVDTSEPKHGADMLPGEVDHFALTDIAKFESVFGQNLNAIDPSWRDQGIIAGKLDTHFLSELLKSTGTTRLAWEIPYSNVEDADNTNAGLYYMTLSAAEKFTRDFPHASRDLLTLSQFNAFDVWDRFTIATGRVLGADTYEVSMLVTDSLAAHDGIVAQLAVPIEALKDAIYDSLIVQTRLKPYLELITSSEVDGRTQYDATQLNTRFDQLFASDPVKALTDLAELNRTAYPALSEASFDGATKLKTWLSQIPSDSPILNKLTEMRLFTAPDATPSRRADVLIGNEAANNFQAGNGSDYLDGDAGADVLFAEYGNDVVLGGAGDDYLSGGEENDWVDGGVDNDLLFGDGGNDTLIGGKGNDTITGSTGTDTYIFNLGDGNDVIEINPDPDSLNIFKLPFEILPSDIAITRESITELKLTYNNGLDSITIRSFFTYADDPTTFGPGLPVEFQFSDGTTWRQVDILSKYFSGTNSDDNLYGTHNADVIRSGDGNDVLDGSEGNDSLIGESGNDLLFGGEGNDTMDGGQGADTLDGGNGNNTYVFGRGYGHDTIVNSRTDAHVVNTLCFDQSIAPADIVFRPTRDGNGDLEISINGSDDRILLDGFFGMASDASGAWTNGVQQIQFADGTLWDLNKILSQLFKDAEKFSNFIGATNSASITGTVGDDIIFSSANADTLIGGGGNDGYWIQDSNTHIFEDSIGGTDEVNLFGISNYTLETNVENAISWSANDIQIQGNNSDNLLVGWSGNDSLIGDQGSDTLQGSSGNDTLDGGQGMDVMYGGAGDDTYIVDNSSDATYDDGDGGADTVISSANYTLFAGIENLTLKTGQATAISAVGNDQNNIITGNSFANSLDGADGNDTLIGGGGNDTMRGGGGDDLYQVDNLSYAIVELEDAGNDTAIISVSGTYSLGANLENGIATSNNTRINGNSGNNTLTASGLNDTLNGGTGDDVYIVGNASTVIQEQASNGIDSVQSSVTWALSANVENLMLTGSAQIDATGNSLDNVLSGNSAKNVLKGLAGNDIYIITSSDDDVIEDANQGVDSVESSVDYGLTSNVENLTLVGQNAHAGTGNELDNTLRGNDTANRLDGGAGNDSLFGGKGDDIYVVDSSDDVVFEEADEGNDSVESSATYALSDNVEKLTLGGNGTIDGRGNSLNNRIVGNASSNRLDGGEGADTMEGGQGDDVYFVDREMDVVVEKTGEGHDHVFSRDSYILSDNVEDLTLVDEGGDGINATGNSLSNVIVGNYGDNVLDGKGGNDTLIGGRGWDTYIVDSTDDVIVEEFDEQSLDSVIASANYTLSANIENLTLVGGNLNGTGNDLDNFILGSSGSNRLEGKEGNDNLYGGSGNDTLDGGVGRDSMQGGKGNDTYVVDDEADAVHEVEGQGTDTVISSIDYVLGLYTENLTLTGLGAHWAIGNYWNNIIQANDAGVTLDGKEGADTLIGGHGDDSFIVDDAGDVVVEYENSGIDTVVSSVSFTLGQYIENLTLGGFEEINGYGNERDNIVVGNYAANVLVGGGGHDTLDGSGGADTMIGGGVSSVYIIDDANDVVIDSNSDSTLKISAFTYEKGSDNLASNVVLISDWGQSYKGNSTRDYVIGSDGDDTIDGGGGEGDDLWGGQGNDSYVVNSTSDRIHESANQGTDSVLSYINYGLDQVRFGNLGDTLNIENLKLVGDVATIAAGNSLNNVLTGNANDNELYGFVGEDTLDGGVGIDTLDGGIGNDTYCIDNAGDVIVELAGNGIDTVRSSINYTLGDNVENLQLESTTGLTGTGNNAANNLVGSNGNDLLTGGKDSDTLSGGLGNDTYRFSSGDGADVINNFDVESSRFDRVLFDATVNVEDISASKNGRDLILTNQASLDKITISNYFLGAAYKIDGVSFNDVVIWDRATLESKISNWNGEAEGGLYIGGAGQDTLMGSSGNDTLDGGAETDTLIGGAGDDTYVVDNSGDVVTEYVNEGTDTVQSSVAWTLGANVENLTLTGTAAISAIGNGLNNSLVGNSGANLLDGGAGNDTMIGGSGNDTYVVDSTSDMVTENANEGADTVLSSVTWTLGANTENLTMTGVSAINGTGNALDNLLIGNDADNLLDGGVGKDTLIGGAGNDTYVFTTAFGQDTISDFDSTASQVDIIRFDLGISPDDIVLERDQSDLYLKHVNGSDVIKIADFYSGYESQIERVEFANGTVWDAAFLASTPYNGTAGDDSLYGGNTEDRISGLEGSDSIVGYAGTDTLEGGAGNDQLYGDAGTDTLDGGTGNDVLSGDDGADTYLFSRGFGQDIITEYDMGSGGNDIVRFANDILPSEVELSRNESDLFIKVIGTNDSITVSSFYAGTALRIERVEFADGTSWSSPDFLAAKFIGSASADSVTGSAGDDYIEGRGGNDQLNGSAGADTLDGGTGNDVLSGDDGADTYLFSRGFGQDTITEFDMGSGGIDIVRFTNGLLPSEVELSRNESDLFIKVIGTNDSITVSGFYADTAQRIERVEFADGTSWISSTLQSAKLVGTAGADSITGSTDNDYIEGRGGNDQISGDAGADTLDGGTGNDALSGDDGADTYLFSSGFGQDIITEYDMGSGGNDIVRFTNGLLPSEVELSRNDSDLFIKVISTNDSITVSGFYTDTAQRIERVEFADGTVWTSSALLAAKFVGTEGADSITGSTGNDYVEGLGGHDLISGDAGADTLDGGTGNDALNGDDGADTYLFSHRFGQDIITEYDMGSGGNDIVRFTNGLLPSEVELSRNDSDLFIKVIDTNDSITVSGFYTDTAQRIERVEFADGTVWTSSALLAAKFVGTEGADSITGSTGNDYVEGLGGHDLISGDAGADTLDGGTGNDALNGDDGADTYLFSRGFGQDIITEYDMGSGGNDIVRFTSGLQPSEVELSRNDSDLFIKVIGTTDSITVSGFYTEAAQRIERVEFADGTVWTSSTLLAAKFAGTEGADSIMGSTGNDRIEGRGGNDQLYGDAGADTLDGGTGDDQLDGGAGNDIYMFDRGYGSDTIYETSGTDTVRFATSINASDVFVWRDDIHYYLDIIGTNTRITVDNWYTGSTYRIENVEFTDGTVWNSTILNNKTTVASTYSDFYWGTASANTYDGLSGDDRIYGFDGNDSLTGGAGNDFIDGGIGDDTMLGGIGDDTYVVDSATDVVTELAGEGNDAVQTSIAYTLGSDVENLTLLNSGGTINGTGNALANVLVGNSSANALSGDAGNDRLDGGEGNDTLDGGTGSDTMTGGAGNDTYVVDDSGDVALELAGQGSDTVQSSISYTLGNDVEKLTLTGTAAINGTGNALANTLTGNSGANTLMGNEGDDILNGGTGADTLIGGTGNDTYTVDNVNDVVTELAGEGIDLVKSSLAYSLAATLENLTLTGSGAITGTGNAANNVITGNTGNNTLNGLGGNDFLDGGTGSDTLVGGIGDDTYVVDVTTDVVTEAVGEGKDTIQTIITLSSLAANVENLALLEAGGAINGTGNALDNVITGNSAINTLNGGTGADTLIGGQGNDIYVVDAGDVVIENTGEGTDTVQSAITWTLSANVEKLTLTGTSNVNAFGNELGNTLTGNSGINTLVGGFGDDVYVVGAGDTVTENSDEGSDTVQSAITWTLGSNIEKLTLTGSSNINGAGNDLDNTLTGNSGVNVLTGGAGNDSINGGAGADSLIGGLGDDVYTVDNAGDVVTENAGEGLDTIQSSVAYTLTSNVENLTLTGTALTGTGNELDNVLTGNASANTLNGGAGNDTLNGASGIDTMVGGVGNDLYIVDNASDAITENANEGVDSVQSSVTYTLVSAGIENLTLAGTSAISGTGNALDNWLIGNSVVNTLTGAAGNDTLDGGAGADSLVGGAGNDVYLVDNASDKITENASEGTDTVQSSVTWTLGTNLENLTLTGATAINGTGNTLSNVLTGNSGNNVLTGGGGNDTYRGGQGTDTLTASVTASNDTYIWGRGEGADTLTDFGGTDQLSILSGVTADQVWFRHVGNNLEVSVIGTTDSFTISGWYTSSANQVESFKLADGNKTLTSGNVQQLVDAMAQFSAPAAGQTTLPANYQTTLNPVITANWA